MDLFTPSARLRPYPKAEDVFVPDQPFLKRVLHPLLSIDLASIAPQWSGQIHLVSPLEPYVEMLGFYTIDPDRDDYQVEDELLFKLEGDRFRFLGDRRLFLMEHDPSDLSGIVRNFRASLKSSWSEHAAHWEEQERSYWQHERVFRETGKLHFLNEDGTVYGQDNAQPLLDYIADFKDGIEYDEDEEQVSPAGRPFIPIARSPGWTYRRSGADDITLYFEPVERLAKITLNWS